VREEMPVAVEDGDHGAVSCSCGDFGGAGPGVNPQSYGGVAEAMHPEAVGSTPGEGGVSDRPRAPTVPATPR